MDIKLLLIIIFVSFIRVSRPRQIPSWFHVCKDSDRMLTKCVQQIFLMFQPQLATGIKELNVAPAEPLVMPVLMLQTSSHNSSYVTTLRDMRVYGVSSYEVKDIRGDMQEGKVIVQLTMPLLKVSADYYAKGTYMNKPVEASGRFHANLTKFQADIKIRAEEGTSNEEEYFLMKDIKVSIQIGSAKGYFTNLSRKNSDLDKMTYEFLRMNSFETLKELRPALEMLITMLIEDVGHKFASFHYDRMFMKT